LLCSSRSCAEKSMIGAGFYALAATNPATHTDPGM